MYWNTADTPCCNVSNLQHTHLLPRGTVANFLRYCFKVCIMQCGARVCLCVVRSRETLFGWLYVFITPTRRTSACKRARYVTGCKHGPPCRLLSDMEQQSGIKICNQITVALYREWLTGYVEIVEIHHPPPPPPPVRALTHLNFPPVPTGDCRTCNVAWHMGYVSCSNVFLTR